MRSALLSKLSLPCCNISTISIYKFHPIKLIDRSFSIPCIMIRNNSYRFLIFISFNIKTTRMSLIGLMYKHHFTVRKCFKTIFHFLCHTLSITIYNHDMFPVDALLSRIPLSFCLFYCIIMNTKYQ